MKLNVGLIGRLLVPDNIGQEIEGGTLVSVRFVALHRHPAMNLTFRLAPQLINSFLGLFIAEAFTSLRGQ